MRNRENDDGILQVGLLNFTNLHDENEGMKFIEEENMRVPAVFHQK